MSTKTVQNPLPVLGMPSASISHNGQTASNEDVLKWRSELQALLLNIPPCPVIDEPLVFVENANVHRGLFAEKQPLFPSDNLIFEDGHWMFKDGWEEIQEALTHEGEEEEAFWKTHLKP